MLSDPTIFANCCFRNEAKRFELFVDIPRVYYKFTFSPFMELSQTIMPFTLELIESKYLTLTCKCVDIFR